MKERNARRASSFPVWLSAILSAASLGALGGWLWFNEGSGATLAFASAVTGVVVAAVAIMSRRPLFAALSACALVGAVVAVARLKRAADGMVLHAWDLVQLLVSPGDMSAAMREHAGAWLACGAAALVAGALLALVFRFERPVLPRPVAAGATALCAAVAAFSAGRLPDPGHTQYFWDGLYLSAFYRSFGETTEAVWRGGLFERGGAAGAPLSPAAACSLAARPPHVLLIHEESVTPPSLFPGLEYDHSLDPFFRSEDGLLHRLRVETYGGASWLTQFSVLAGVSAHAFGSMKNFVQPFMTGRLKETVPQILAGCGYRNMMFTAWPKQFMGVARFYESIGIREIFDQKAQGNVNENERDRFFFGNALREIARHVEVSRQPLFLFIETMSAHWPYDVTYEPGVDVPGGAPGEFPEVHEYLRRLAMVKMDDDWLRAELARRFPSEAFLIVRYGDHHPMATRLLDGLPEEIVAESVHLPPDSPAFTTFYAVNGLGYAPPPPPAVDLLDAAYLGAILLQAARAPLPASWRERLDLMRSCGGSYWTCPDHEKILAFQRRLADGGLVGAR